MLATFALAALVQVPPTVPRDAELIYPVMPMVAPSAGSAVSLSQSILSTTVTLTNKEASYETLALYKNTTNAEGNVDLTVALAVASLLQPTSSAHDPSAGQLVYGTEITNACRQLYDRS